ncbi:MAG: TerB family tellurite resistance protein [Scytolyngbya sp. HA4215-MV1]|jgi:uncharacterized tellurite resistance protein B-like protein|nr:TerB family tellurite resistance protein [Scytolyngbya sp. HA4215-MV1]
MSADPKVTTLIKILIGAAWIDGTVQAQEREYLHRIVKEKGVENELEIQPLLYEYRPVKPEECYDWIQEYLGESPDSESCQRLIEEISAMIYSDGEVASEEAKLLTNLQQLDPANAPADGSNAVLKAVRQLYKRWTANLQ